MAIGRPNPRKDVFEPIRLDPYDTSNTLLASPENMDPNLKLTMPKGMELVRPDSSIPHSQLGSKLSGYYATQLRRAFGYVVDILRVGSINTSSRLMVTAVVKIPFVYWATIDRPKSWTYARFIAFPPNAAATVPGSIVIGVPISGAVINADSK